MKCFSAYIKEGAYDFKDFKDPFAVMSPEDRKEANRLFKQIMRVVPSSPRQRELMRKYAALMVKYKIWDAEGARKYVGEDWSSDYKKSINCNNPKGFSQRAHCRGRKKR